MAGFKNTIFPIILLLIAAAVGAAEFEESIWDSSDLSLTTREEQLERLKAWAVLDPAGTEAETTATDGQGIRSFSECPSAQLFSTAVRMSRLPTSVHTANRPSLQEADTEAGETCISQQQRTGRRTWPRKEKPEKRRISGSSSDCWPTSE